MLGGDERKHNPKTSSPFNLIQTQSILSINHLIGLYNRPLRKGGVTWNDTLNRVRRDPAVTQANLPSTLHSPGQRPFQVGGHLASAMNCSVAEFTRPPNLWLNSFNHCFFFFLYCSEVHLHVMAP